VQKVDERRDSIPYPTFVPKTLFETLRDYFNNPEDKADNPNGVGILARRTVSVVEHIYIGKETNEVWLEVEEDTDGIIVPPIEQVFGSSGLGNAIRAHGSRRIVEADPSLKTATLDDVARGGTKVTRDADKIITAINKLGAARFCCPEN
jgi:hypothetical protein